MAKLDSLKLQHRLEILDVQNKAKNLKGGWVNAIQCYAVPIAIKLM